VVGRLARNTPQNRIRIQRANFPVTLLRPETETGKLIIFD
jgi:hypothetical protein